MNKQSIDKAVQTLINSGEADNESSTLNYPQLEIEDVYISNIHKFTEKTIKAIGKIKATNLIHQIALPSENLEIFNIIDFLTKLDLNKEIETVHNYFSNKRELDTFLDERCKLYREMYQVRFLGSRYYSKENSNLAKDELISIINDLGEKGFIKGHLLELSHMHLCKSITLLSSNIEPNGGVFVSYLLFDRDGMKYLEDNKLDFYEGGTPLSVDEEK